ncbi:MAG: hypothetical protein VR73_03745 [Gammaproteobacteria bacterium BRH_c0]|nr:MAG: hypothetical protein VR73_03745 [Gammaproteobacteria bacterium BRH_c0]
MSLPLFVNWWSNQTDMNRYLGLDSPYALPGDLYWVETEEEDSLWASGFKNSDCCKAWLGADFDCCLITTNGKLVIDKKFPPEHIDSLHKRLSAFLA